MAHVHISAGGTDVFKMTIDDVDISRSVLADGFGIEWPEDVTVDNPVVVLRLDADVLDIDLPQSLLDAVITKAGA